MTQRAELAPGTYQVRNVGTGIAAGITVPTLTVAIAQASPSVGAVLTLTTNAAAGAAYQWRAGGVDIGGATSATFNTTGRSAGEVITCRVVSGAQTVTSAGVALAAGGMSTQFLGTSTHPGGFAPNNHVAPVSLTGGQKYLLAVAFWPNAADNLGVSVNGTSAGAAVVTSVQDDLSRVAIFEVTPATSGTAVAVTHNTTVRTDVGYLQIPNSATVQAFVGSVSTAGNVRTLSVNVDQGDAIFAIMATDGAGATITWGGLTQFAGGSVTNGHLISFAGAENVAAATPRVITGTSSDTNNNNAKVAALVVIG